MSEGMINRDFNSERPARKHNEKPEESKSTLKRTAAKIALGAALGGLAVGYGVDNVERAELKAKSVRKAEDQGTEILSAKSNNIQDSLDFLEENIEKLASQDPAREELSRRLEKGRGEFAKLKERLATEKSDYLLLAELDKLESDLFSDQKRLLFLLGL